MTFSVIKFCLGLYMIAGLGTAEWGLRQAIVRQRLTAIGPKRGYLLIAILGPLFILSFGIGLMACTLARRHPPTRLMLGSGLRTLWIVAVLLASVLALKGTLT